MTLVEILVVIAMIAVLATTAALVFKKSKAKTQQLTCMNNMRQIGLGLQFYADDHGGTYPETSHTAETGQSWIFLLEDYLQNFDRVRICPADPLAEERERMKGTSYILNSFVFVPAIDAFGEPDGPIANRPMLFAQPSATLLMFCCADDHGLRAGDDHTHSDSWVSWEGLRRDIAPDRHFRNGNSGLEGASNYLFADGHVETWTAQAVKTRIDKGDNIAKIPGL
jgi:prepilin-type processing-associated H-X9-DG protein